MQQRKQEAAESLDETILSSDIEEVLKLQAALRVKGGSRSKLNRTLASGPPMMNTTDDDDSSSSGSRKRLRKGIYIDDTEESENHAHADEHQKSEVPDGNRGNVLSKSYRVIKNFRKLESAYFLTRRRAFKPTGRTLIGHSPL
ncbi:Protein SPA1-RELATED 3 [Olea europaea subsp. europaea]|uniref:Protein SPA1-RELATED 3 n=1 Tax=Olea europaea subsp. europaea TaxID=158383 RepID=A0A8S0S803_OLEEU|nr:Protein SPA1-RELATED 3 [Olea europaea subsp. europaea]